MSASAPAKAHLTSRKGPEHMRETKLAPNRRRRFLLVPACAHTTSFSFLVFAPSLALFSTFSSLHFQPQQDSALSLQALALLKLLYIHERKDWTLHYLPSHLSQEARESFDWNNGLEKVGTRQSADHSRTNQAPVEFH